MSKNPKTLKPTPAPNTAPPEAPAQPTPWAYSEQVKAHFLEPKNFLMGDESQFDFNAKGTVGNKICGDEMTMYLKIAQGKIQDIRWRTYGCASAIASTSALSELAKGQALDAALKITPEQIADYLGGLPERKFHCSVLGSEALAEAVDAYRNPK
ncbi:MAG: iron-sulfur cluster assembly scaffold protein [Candidatus Nomurabacteria bacterium]|jgi:nitrogen fixation NifU-like protein|nr:iron-sulfur cluster assembly scaffold protein [Candidatus Nomurabacteria bacterium]